MTRFLTVLLDEEKPDIYDERVTMYSHTQRQLIFLQSVVAVFNSPRYKERKNEKKIGDQRNVFTHERGHLFHDVFSSCSFHKIQRPYRPVYISNLFPFIG